MIHHQLKQAPTRPMWYSLVVLLVVTIGMAGFNVWYTNHIQQVADRRWCALFDVMNPPALPPTTARGREIAEEITRMRRGFRCPPG